MKKYIALILAMIMVFSMAGCQKASKFFKKDTASEESVEEKPVDAELFCVGFIFPAEAEAPDTEARVHAVRKMQKETGLTDEQIILATNVSKEKCPEQLEELRKSGCNMIFALGSRYEEAVVADAQDNPEVTYCLEGGKASIKNSSDNVHIFDSKIYEAYYAAGVAAGMKLNSMLDNETVYPSDCRVGFVAYKEAPETTVCINAFYSGIKTVCSQSTIDVRYVGQRGNYDADGECARQLAASGVGLMCQYTFTTAVAAVCAEQEIPVFGNEDNIIHIAPVRAIASTYTDWSIYYTKAVSDTMNGQDLPKDWLGGYKEGAVRLTQLNDAKVVNGTAKRLIEVEKSLRNKSVKIFEDESKSRLTLMEGIRISTENYIQDQPAEESTTEEGSAEEEQ